jgi:ankyrin repeat protein
MSEKLLAAYRDFKRSFDVEALRTAIEDDGGETVTLRSLVELAASGGQWRILEQLARSGLRLEESDDFPSVIAEVLLRSPRSTVEVTSGLIRLGAGVNTRTCNEWTPLHVACWRHQRKVIPVLVAAGADINASTGIDDYNTPLMDACELGDAKTVEVLLDLGADPMILNPYSGKSVHMRFQNGEFAHQVREVLADRRTAKRTKWKSSTR